MLAVGIFATLFKRQTVTRYVAVGSAWSRRTSPPEGLSICDKITTSVDALDGARVKDHVSSYELQHPVALSDFKPWSH